MKMEFYYCKKSFPVMLRYNLFMLKYLLNKSRYPLFFTGSGDGGVIASRRLLKQMKMRKFVKFNGHYYFSLSVPHWPSRAFDNMVAHGGLNIAAAGTPHKKQIDNAIIGITRKCRYECKHCYEQFNLGQKETIPVTILGNVIEKLQNYGTSIITLSGGEPMLRFQEMLEILNHADQNLSDFHIHTSGHGVTPEKARALKEAGLHAAGIGLDDLNPARNDIFRGFKGAYEQAVKAIRTFQEAGIFTYVNTCINRNLIRSGDIHPYFDFMKSLNIGFVRWLEPKPCGAFLSENDSILLSEQDRKIVTDLYVKANSGTMYPDHPVISYEAYTEMPENMGCIMGGNSLLYIDAAGNLLPCVFLPVSFGNIMDEDFTVLLNRMRNAIPAPLRRGCPSIALGPELRKRRKIGNDFPVPYEEVKSLIYGV